MHTVLVVLFPVLLVLFEAGLRFVAKEPVWDFVGPTLSVAGLSFLVALTKVRAQHIVSETGETAIQTDGDFVNLVFICIIVAILFWCASLYLSFGEEHLKFWVIPVHAIIGTFLYLSSLILSSLKEA